MSTLKKISLAIVILAFCIPMQAQQVQISKEQLIALTPLWKGERFPDGRPKVPDDIIRRMKSVSVEEAWAVMKNAGYGYQVAEDWQVINPDSVLVGRAVTATFMPARPDVWKAIDSAGKKEGKRGQNTWPVDLLVKGDVYVADGFGKIAGGTLMGSTLGNSIYSKSGNGVIFNGSARDLEGLSEIKGFNAFVRDFHPSFLEEMVLMGLNTPIRIGHAIVLPGDLVIGDREGVLFIPAQLAEQVVTTAEFVTLKDKFGFEMVKTNKYSTGQIDSQWTDEIKIAFLKWLDQHPELGKMSKEKLDKIMSNRTW